MIACLLCAGCDIEMVNCVGKSPLQIAVIWEDMTLIETLLTAGSNVHACDQNGYTPLHMAVDQGCLMSYQD